MEQQSNSHGAAQGRAFSVFAAVMVGAMMFTGGPANAAGNAARGAQLYQQCEDCHSIDENDVGPMHKGVVGRIAGTVPGYNYSPALRNSKIVWTEENLNKWLINPQALIPGTKMFFPGVKDPQDRADIIEFLKERAR